MRNFVGMANDRDKIYKQAQEQIKKHNLFFIEDVVSFIPISKPTFYDYFKVDSNEFNTLKGLLEENKVNTKVELREKFRKGDSSVEKLALYKLIGTDEERKKLSQTYHDVTTDGKELKVTGFLPEGFED